MFNVGDEIEVIIDNYFVVPVGTIGKITSKDSKLYHIDFDGQYQYLYIGAEHNVKLITPLLSGDTVEYIGTDQNYAGLYGKVITVGTNNIVVQFNVLTSTTIVDKQELKRVSSPIQPSQQSQTPQHTYRTSFNNATQATLNAAQQYTGLTTRSGVLSNIDDSFLQKNNICKHEYKIYTGLTKRYDYCTKCDHIKNERGIYE